MKISRGVRDYADAQAAQVKAEGIAGMASAFRERGGDIYLPSSDSEVSDEY